MCLVPDVDWCNSVVIQREIYNRPIILQDFRTPFDPMFGYIRFRFPESVKYPCIPVSVEGCLIFPQSSEGLDGVYASGPEIYLALRLGAEITAVRVYVGTVLVDDDLQISHSLYHTVKQLVVDRKCVQDTFGKGTIPDFLLKTAVTSLYGKTAQDVVEKSSWDAYKEIMQNIGGSRITSPVHACLTTAGVRCCLIAAMNQLIVEDLWASYDKKHEPRFLSVICNFLMGLRAGELCALRWRDLDMEKWVITIHQEMVHMDASQLNDSYYDVYKVSGQIAILPGQEGKKGLYVLLDHTKTHTERTIAIIPKGQKIFQLLKENAPDAKPDDFIFGYGSKYLNLRALNSVLEYACAHIETDVKRSHKLRKTYASRLNAAGLPLDQIRANLGHASLTTTLGYIYNPLTPEESLKLMEKAFDD